MSKSSIPNDRRGSRVGRFYAGLACVLALAASCCGRSSKGMVVVAGGDCLLDRYDGRLAADPRGDRRWDSLVRATRKSDAFLFNLETVVGRAGTPREKRFVFRAPTEALYPLTRFPRPVAALANNHSMDFGPDGLIATLAALDEADIAHAGAGRTCEEAWTEARIECPAGTLSVLSCGFDNNPDSFSESQAAVLAPLNFAKLEERIRICRRTSLAVAVLLHWGLEYDTRIGRSERLVARALAEAGADLVIGSGPHVLRGLELHRGSLICYSLGNLVFDDLGSEETSASFVVRMQVVPGEGGGNTKRYDVAPLRTRRVEEGPARPTPDDARNILRELALRSPDSAILGDGRFSREDGLYWFPVGKR